MVVETGNQALAKRLKDEGNEAYKNGDWNTALEKYTEALKTTNDNKEKSILYKNRAAVYLRTEEYDNVVTDCTESLILAPNDPKALFRRAQAYDALDQPEKAYTDARGVQKADAKNKDVQVLLTKLHKIVQDKLEESNKTSGRVKQLFETLFDTSLASDKRETAANNLIALAKERAGADLMMQDNVIGRVVQMLKMEKNSNIRLSCTRSFSELCKDVNKAKEFLRVAGLPWLIDLMNSQDTAQVNSTQYCFQMILNTLTGMDAKTEQKPDKALMISNQKEVDSVMAMLTTSSTMRSMSGICRDAIIELLMRNVEYKYLDWGNKFIRCEGVEKLLDIASELPEYHYESCINITDDTRMTTAICLSKVYETQYDDKARDHFVAIVDEYIKSRLLTPDIESKVRVCVTLTTLLLGPLDVGNVFIGREGVLEMLLVMANTDDILQQKVACEALIAAATKKDKCKAIVSQGTDILKRLYQSKNEGICVRALVGLCKLGSLGGTDATTRPFAEGASLKLAEACRRFLVSKQKDMRRWACEGLSYLTLDAEVKEKLIEDTSAIRSMIELAQSGDLNCLYGVVTTFVNLCNAYDKQEILPEMIELAKFSKQHIPEEHELDDKDFVDKRINVLTKEGAATALAALSRTQSSSSRELIARLFNAICDQQHNRGLVVQQGGVKALLGLSQEGTEKGRQCAAQALARIAITINPEVAFPGQRSYEVVRPLLKLLDINCSGLENFESLMGLCNIAGMSESARQRIMKEKGLPLIEHYMYEDHELIRRAAVQCMANMCASPDIVEILEGENDRLKYMFLCSSDEDPEIIKAASGALCMVLADSEKCRNKIFQTKDWAEILQFLLSHSDPEIQFRGTVMVYYLVSHNKVTAEHIFDTHCKDALFAIARIDNPELVKPKAKEYAENSIRMAIQEWKIIKDPNAED